MPWKVDLHDESVRVRPHHLLELAVDSWEGHFCLVNGEYAGNEDGIHLEGQDLRKVCGGGRVDPSCWTERGGSYE